MITNRALGPITHSARGIEITLDALLALLAERYPNLVDWRYFMSPEIDVVVNTRTLGLYQSHRVHTIDEHGFWDDVAYPFRRLSEGAPIPVGIIRSNNVVTDDGLPRCGYFETDRQCEMPDRHEGSHGKVSRLA